MKKFHLNNYILVEFYESQKGTLTPEENALLNKCTIITINEWPFYHIPAWDFFATFQKYLQDGSEIPFNPNIRIEDSQLK